jgi:hypothetical protein
LPRNRFQRLDKQPGRISTVQHKLESIVRRRAPQACLRRHIGCCSVPWSAAHVGCRTRPGGRSTWPPQDFPNPGKAGSYYTTTAAAQAGAAPQARGQPRVGAAWFSGASGGQAHRSASKVPEAGFRMGRRRPVEAAGQFLRGLSGLGPAGNEVPAANRHPGPPVHASLQHTPHPASRPTLDGQASPLAHQGRRCAPNNRGRARVPPTRRIATTVSNKTRDSMP